METLMTLGEVATYLNVSKDTVYRMTQEGKIPATKIGQQWRYKRAEVDQWLEENKHTTQPPGGSDADR